MECYNRWKIKSNQTKFSRYCPKNLHLFPKAYFVLSKSLWNPTWVWELLPFSNMYKLENAPSSQKATFIKIVLDVLWLLTFSVIWFQTCTFWVSCSLIFVLWFYLGDEVGSHEILGILLGILVFFLVIWFIHVWWLLTVVLLLFFAFFFFLWTLVGLVIFCSWFLVSLEMVDSCYNLWVEEGWRRRWWC